MPCSAVRREYLINAEEISTVAHDDFEEGTMIIREEATMLRITRGAVSGRSYYGIHGAVAGRQGIYMELDKGVNIGQQLA